MNKNRILLVTAALCLTATAGAFAANPFIGTWKLDEAKSKFSSGAPKNHTVTYSEAKKDMIKVTVDGVDKDGKPVHWTWKGKFDGQPYKVKGSTTADTIALKSVNERTNDMTVMKDGKVVQTGTIAVAEDGKSRTVTTTSTDAKGEKHTDEAYYTKE